MTNTNNIKPIIVMTAKGKGDSKADTISVSVYYDKSKADEYVSANNEDGKYWKYSWIVREYRIGNDIEVYRDYVKDLAGI